MEFRDLYIFPAGHPPSPYDHPVTLQRTGWPGHLMEGLSLCAVGWLERPGYPTGPVADECMDALFFASEDHLFRDGTRGIHSCTLCDAVTNPGHSFGEQIITWRGHTMEILGYGHYLVQLGSTVYMAPRLILHYILGHQYCPPQEFIQATLHGKFLTEDDLVSG